MGSYRSYDGRSEAEEDAYSSIFKTLTIKQHEVYALVAEGRSSKEIAWKLGITDSAVNQRIEAVRSRAGSPTRAELARAYRRFSTSRDLSAVETTMRFTPAPAAPFFHTSQMEDCGAACAPLVQHQAVQTVVRDSGERAGLIVPSIFLGSNAALNRAAAMVLIAVGLLSTALIGLGVLHALATML